MSAAALPAQSISGHRLRRYGQNLFSERCPSWNLHAWRTSPLNLRNQPGHEPNRACEQPQTVPEA